MKKKLAILSGSVLGFAPFVALAQVTAVRPGKDVCILGTLGGWICKIGELVNAVVPLLIALAVVYFIWGVITYVIASDEEAKEAGRNRIIFGIIGLTVIVAMWGIVGVLKRTFVIDNTETIELPTIRVPGQ
jgi:hypothetical protein